MPLEDDARRLEQWLLQGKHGGMHYMERNFDLRIDPTKLVPGAQSVITLLKNYHQPALQPLNAPRISQYAFGEDYHDVIRRQLNLLLAALREKFGEIQGRGFVDSAPVLERSWALRSGLGWIGKNGNLINKQVGSYFFIATLITDVVLDYDEPFTKDYCGTCTRCIDACPTEAILPNKVVDGSRCIAYFTIESKSTHMSNEVLGKLNNWMFGCDICQEVCPWNRFAQPHQETAFTPIPALLQFSKADWLSITEQQFKELFKRSPLQRAGLKGIMRNVRAL